MLELKVEKVEAYLSEVYKTSVTVTGLAPLRSDESADLKGLGYGTPYIIEFTIDKQPKCCILETMRPEGFGHDHFSDRAGILLWQHSVFNKLPKHVRSVDVGSFLSDCQSMKSVGDCVEFFLLTEFIPGSLYHLDLDTIKQTCSLTNLDEERCVALSEYLAKIHSVKKKDEPQLYARRIRDLIGHGEGIFGLTDSYPKGLDYANDKFLLELEKRCLEWRWRLKRKADRLAQVHGDFHPWNIMFREGTDFTTLDRSRGEWGEPADDVACMTVNYLFYSLQAFGDAEGPFGRLFVLFWKNYLDSTGDDEILKMVQPFYAWRSLVLASPLWYPSLSMNVRKKILRFAEKVLDSKEFRFESVESYLK
jgi:hypothetical protein